MTRPDPSERMVEAFFDAPQAPIITAETQMAENAEHINAALHDFALRESSALPVATGPAGLAERASSVAFLNTLLGGSARRFRGSLAMSVYLQDFMSSRDVGTALGVHSEIVQAYAVITDDGIDGTEFRRGQPVAHRQVAAMLRDETERSGAPFRMTEAETKYIAQSRADAYHLDAYRGPFEDLLVRPQYLTEAMDVSQRISIQTILGQIEDIATRRNVEASEDDILAIYRRKTALYTVAAPILTARTLASGPLLDAETEYILYFAEQLGVAYQLKDDLKIMGTYNADPTVIPDKDEAADIMNGTITPLVIHALNPANRNISDGKKRFLQNMLTGEGQWTLDPDELAKKFHACQSILHDSGAVKHVEGLVQQHRAGAIAVLDEAESRRAISSELAGFLRDIAK